ILEAPGSGRLTHFTKNGMRVALSASGVPWSGPGGHTVGSKKILGFMMALPLFGAALPAAAADDPYRDRYRYDDPDRYRYDDPDRYRYDDRDRYRYDDRYYGD